MRSVRARTSTTICWTAPPQTVSSARSPAIPANVALAFRVYRRGASAPAKADNGERLMFSGSNAEIIGDLRAMRELGVKAIDFNFAAPTVDAMRRFHEEVVANPLIGSSTGARRTPRPAYDFASRA
jgi:hypothetical protein